MYHTYILKSKKNNQYYIGYTSDLDVRLKLHNNNKVSATKNLGPWEIFHKEEFQTEQEAIHRERQIKSWKNREAIERLKFKQNRVPICPAQSAADKSRILDKIGRSSTFSRDNIEITAHAEENKKPGG